MTTPGRLEIDGTFGVVTSTHWIATAVGMGILERGGNAFDAAVAVAFTLEVVEPHLNGPGGEAPLLLHAARSDRTIAVCGQGVAPAAASIGHFRSLGLDLVPGTGLLAACVPGAFDALMLVLAEHGTMTPRDVMTPAIGYARAGYPVVPRMASTIAATERTLAEHWPTSAAIYLPGGRVPEVGSLIANPALADTFERILTEVEAAASDRDAQVARARDVWREGFVAEAIDRFSRTQRVMDVTGEPHSGLLTGDDLARWSATVEAPVTHDFGRYTVAKCGPWTQGPVLLQQLALLDGLLPVGGEPIDATSAEVVHLMVECAKLAYADRDTYYGDPDFVDVPLDVLLSRSYNDARRELVGETASMEHRPGVVEGFGATMSALARDGSADVGSLHASGAGEPTFAPSGLARSDTVHFDIVDRDGNMVSATPSGGWFSSSPVIPELGFSLGSRGQMFVLDEGHPAALAPGKRPRTTLSPSLARRDGEAYLAWGTPGGDYQDQWTAQVLVRHGLGGLGLQAAIDAPTWHTAHLVGSFWPRQVELGDLTLEGTEPEAVVEELRRRGHRVQIGGAVAGGRVTAAARDGERRRAATSGRWGQGHATGR
jgi:gamma-glutamyltranspeptidase/glutathione hydrolase